VFFGAVPRHLRATSVCQCPNYRSFFACSLRAAALNNTCSNEAATQKRTATMITVASVTQEDDVTETVYDCDFVAACNGTSIWGDTAGKQVQVSGICVREEDGYKSVNVTHNADWTIYTDKGFAAAISRALGYDVDFTEQGMQEDCFASMEA